MGVTEKPENSERNCNLNGSQGAREPTKEAMRQAKKIADNYIGAKLRVSRYPKKRPTFLKQMSVTLDDYEQTGCISYNRELATKLCIDDAVFLQDYVDDMFTVWIVERVVANINGKRARGIAEDTILRGKKCEALTEKYGVSIRTIQRQKREVIKELAGLLV